MADPASVVVVGSANLDTKLEVQHIPVAGETILSRRRSVSPGGKGANQAAAAAAAGARVKFIGAIGDDEHGRIAVRNLSSWGVDLSSLQVLARVPSGEAHLIVAESNAENLIVVSPGANEHLSPAHVARALETDRSTVLLTQLETPLTVLEVCAEHRGSQWRILNPAPVAPAFELRSLLRGFNLLVPNRMELAHLAGSAEPRSLEEVRACTRRIDFDGAIVVTLGSAGAALFPQRDSSPVVIPPPPVRPVDTTGAGDVFCGHLARELAEHGDLERAVRAAVHASALSTELPYAQLLARPLGVSA